MTTTYKVYAPLATNSKVGFMDSEHKNLDAAIDAAKPIAGSFIKEVTARTVWRWDLDKGTI
jgi:hypothetical protein